MKKTSPYILIVLSFLVIILIGSVLLALPISKVGQGTLPFFDALILSTSAVTITGLTTITNLSVTLSVFGKVVLILLVQIGGLSIVTISVFVMYILGAKIGIMNRILVKESFNQNSSSGMVKLVIHIMIFTLSIEVLGFIINLFIFLPLYDTWEAIGISAFHAISSFNNAGFDLLGASSLQTHNTHILLNINTAVLIMLGGFGFIVLNDIFKKRSYKKLSIHSKIVIKMNLILWIGGMLVFRISSYQGRHFTWLESFFLSVTARTAGFANVDMGSISALTTFVLLILMFIGGSPGSTGGGIKTTTFYALIKSTHAYTTGKQVTTHKRLIGDETRHKAAILLTTALLIVSTSTFLLLLLEDISLEEALFNVVATFSNVGLVKNVTAHLGVYTKILLCFLMFVGRIGPLTIMSAVNKKWFKKELHSIEYIEEKMMIG